MSTGKGCASSGVETQVAGRLEEMELGRHCWETLEGAGCWQSDRW